MDLGSRGGRNSNRSHVVSARLIARSIVKNSSEYDVVVLGAGAGGMTAACVAAAEGLRVLLIEKSPFVGGTTALSGGMVWIPANSKAAQLGVADTIERARLYLEHTVGGSFNENLRGAFLANADAAIAYLEAKTSVRLRPVKIYPDYYPDLPGATTAGRVLEPVPFDGRALGEHFRVLRWPLPEFMLLGGMMIDRADIPHFRRAGRSLRSTAHVVRLLARYGWERLFVQRGASLYLGNALAGRLLHSLLTLKVDLVLNAVVSRLIYDGASVRGVAMTNGAGRKEILARRGVVLATGGFSHRPEMRARYLPNGARVHSAACPSNAGDGIELASLAGGRVWDRNTDNAFWAPVSSFVRRNGSEGIFPHTVTDRAKPGVIAVNRRGLRFTNEAISYHEFVRAMFQAHHEAPSIPAYLICDRRFLWKYGLGAVKPFSLSLREHLKSGYLTRGRTVGALARALGIDPDNLEASVRRFNDDAREGIDRDFGRGGDAYQRYLGDADNQPNPCVAPIEHAPFYSVALYPGDLGTAAGLVTDEHARVLDDANRPIRCLYACGNDMNSIMNGAYPGPGITLGPALTFAYLAARHIVSQR
jgi:succinate dehydrogenase/fumarate reductase flavoprotein subunit